MSLNFAGRTLAAAPAALVGGCCKARASRAAGFASAGFCGDCEAGVGRYGAESTLVTCTAEWE